MAEQQIKQLPKTPKLPSDVSDGGKSLVKALWDHIIQSNETVNRLIKTVQQIPEIPDTPEPPEITPESIGAVPNTAIIGIPFPWFTDTFPDGTLECRGQTFSAVDYPDLALKYPTLTLPDIRAVVPRGLDRGRGLDIDGASRTVGSYQADELKSHSHSLGVTTINGSGGFLQYGNSYKLGGTEGASSTTTSGGTETRMKNVACYWLVYARITGYDASVEGGNALTLGGHPLSYFASKADIANDLVTRPWIVPTLLNGWQNYGFAYNNAGYYKDCAGTVHLQGMVEGGSIATGTAADYIFVLPAGYRPGGRCIFNVQSSGTGRCDIDGSGVVIAVAGNNTWFSLDGITFRAEA